jgi:putative transposase
MDFMRSSRLKPSPELGVAAYHVISRTVNGEFLLDDEAKEILRQHLWRVSDYCGVQIVTYAIMSNHFHVLVVVPKKVPIDDNELLRRYRVLYPHPTKYQAARLEVIEAQLASNGPQAVAWRRRQNALMGDLSPFVQLLKQRFTIWFNRNRGRFGTLWAERFKSDLIEPAHHALKVTAAYIDLNSIRAAMVADPKNYTFCGYADAVAGHQRAQQGLFLVFGEGNWDRVQESYRQFLFSSGSTEVEGKARIQPGQFEAVIEAGGKLPLSMALLCRNRFFSDGAVLGSRQYVETQLELYREKTGCRGKAKVRPLPSAITDWGDLVVLRGLRKNAIVFPQA